jgi:cyclophilin family peptidyl-prolyl cis-trans isomerase
MTQFVRPVGVALTLVMLVAACSTGGGAGRSSGPPVATTSPSAPSASNPPCPTSAPPPMAAGQKRTVTIETVKGTIEVTVESDLGPLAAANFVALAGCGFYDGLVFHRVVPGFVIQGGDPTGSGSGGPGYEFADDPVEVPYARGVVAMANSGPDTNGSQFFIVLEDAGLDPAYSVFGRVTLGMEAVDGIALAADGQNPTNPIAMDAVTVAP